MSFHVEDKPDVVPKVTETASSKRLATLKGISANRMLQGLEDLRIKKREYS